MAPRTKQPSIASCDKCRSLKVKCLRSDTQTECAKSVLLALMFIHLQIIISLTMGTDDHFQVR
jgi:hypothetical protein